MECILHIGTEKTGTSSLQACFYQNRDLLARQGIELLQSAGRDNARKLACFAMSDHLIDEYLKSNKISSIDQKISFNKTLAKAVSKELSRLSPCTKTLLISSEHFHSRCIQIEDLIRLRALLSPFVKSFKVIVYLRNQLDLARSLFSTALKSGYVLDGVDDYIVETCQASKAYYNYSALLERWSEVFGVEALMVRPYHRTLLYKQCVMQDFFKTALADLRLDNFKWPEPLNTEISYFGQQLLNVCNQLVSSSKNKETMFLRKKIIRKLDDCGYGQGEVPSLKTIKIVRERFKTMNQLVTQNWFNTLSVSPLEIALDTAHEGIKPSFSENDEIIKYLLTSAPKSPKLVNRLLKRFNIGLNTVFK
jgi:hypothetical protein